MGQRAQQAAAGQVDPVTAALLPPGASPSLIQPATGGKALAQIIHRQTFGGLAPTDGEMGTAIDDIAGYGLIHPQEADAAHVGLDVTPAFASTIAHHVAAQRGDPRSQWSAAGSMSEAQGDVASALGGDAGATAGALSGTPAPQAGLVSPLRPPVRDPIRWQAARADNMAHADDMVALATDPAEQLAILQIKGAKQAAQKRAILQQYQQANPGADTSRFTAQLMKGV